MLSVLIRQVQEKFGAYERRLYCGFVHLEKAFGRVPREVIRPALKKAGTGKVVKQLNTGPWSA